MRSATLRQLEQATGRDKLVVLALTLDRVIENLKICILRNESVRLLGQLQA